MVDFFISQVLEYLFLLVLEDQRLQALSPTMAWSFPIALEVAFVFASSAVLTTQQQELGNSLDWLEMLSRTVTFLGLRE